MGLGGHAGPSPPHNRPSFSSWHYPCSELYGLSGFETSEEDLLKNLKNLTSAGATRVAGDEAVRGCMFFLGAMDNTDYPMSLSRMPTTRKLG